MKMKYILSAILFACLSLNVSGQEESDSITLLSAASEDMPTGQYTFTFKNLQLKDESSDAIIKFRIGDNSMGGDLHITNDKIYIDCNGTITNIAENMPAPLEAHDYTIARLTNVRIYRDGTLYGNITHKSYKDGKPRLVLKNASQVSNYEFELTSNSSSITPDESAYENNIDNMLTGFTNLSPDPYLNTGFDRSGTNAGNRGFWTANAKNNGWGSDIWAVSEEAYSGPTCVKLEGQSVYSSQGAALKQPISFTAKTPYVVRAMVKSDGWEGMIGIADESNFIHVTDTKGQWKQVEAVLIPQYTWNSNTTETFYVHNADYDSSGTLLIDNIEVYKGLTGTSIGSNTKVVSANVNATTNWSPAHAVDVYRLGFTENNKNVYSQINPDLVSISGAPYFTRTFEGSKMNAIFFPNGLTNVTVTGRFDYRDHYEYHLYHGLDYICQRLNPDTGRFEYLSSDDDITAGGYIIQFADNYDGIPVRFDMNPADKFQHHYCVYKMDGNMEYKNISIDNTYNSNILFFDEDLQQFNRIGSINSNAECVRPFMPFIETSENVHVIAPEGATGIRILNAVQGSSNRYLVKPVANGVEITGHGTSNIGVFNLTGQLMKKAHLEEGVNFIHLQPGIYIVAGKKVMVR